MAYPFTEDHDMIRDAAKGWLTEWYDGGKGPERTYESGTPFDASAWESFAGELGLGGIAIDEAYGGAQLGDLGRVVVMEELGASLCAVPFLTTCGVAADVIAAAGTEDMKSDVLGKIAAGQIKLTYCDGHDAFTFTADKISGTVTHVAYAACADMIVTSLRTGGELQIIGVPAGVKGLTLTPHQTMDPTRGFADVTLDGVALSDVQIIGTISEEYLNDIVTRSFIALAAESIGGAQKCLDLTLEYTAQRVQFDRTIASFQAVKHRCADMFILIEAARSAVYAAAVADEGEKTQAALVAKANATDAFFEVAGHAIQLHGGIGFTWEYPLHFFFKRARANRSMFGSSSRDYERLAGHIFGDAA
ncbi:MAG: acyl-CoA dehydrogenase family protein [Maricaulaceae bacterium]